MRKVERERSMLSVFCAEPLASKQSAATHAEPRSMARRIVTTPNLGRVQLWDFQTNSPSWVLCNGRFTAAAIGIAADGVVGIAEMTEIHTEITEMPSKIF